MHNIKNNRKNHYRDKRAGGEENKIINETNNSRNECEL